MPKPRVLTHESFEELLAWLGPTREEAAEKYEEVRRSLIKIFVWRGFSSAEDMADETITRVAARAANVRHGFVGDPVVFFYAVANRLIKEELRSATKHTVLEDEHQSPEQAEPPDPNDEKEHECLRFCLQRQEPIDREMIVRYYVGQKREKILNRQEMARKLGIPPGALRVRMHRIRQSLERCMEQCLNGGSSNETN